MATEFNAAQWAGINTRQPEKRDFNADYAEAAETQEGFNRGLSPNKAVMGGMRARQAALDPMYELKRSQAMLSIATTAQQYQENILSSQIKVRQIDDEAADTLAFSKVAEMGTWQERSEALSRIVPRSAKGVHMGVAMRQQLGQLRMQDWTSRAMLRIAEKNPGLAMRLSTMDPASPEFLDAIQEAASQTDVIPVIKNIQGDGGVSANALINPKTGAFQVIPEAGAKVNEARELATIRAESSLSTFLSKQEATFDAQAAALEGSTRESDKKYAKELRAQAQSFRDKRTTLGKEEAAPASTNAPASSMNFIFNKDGQLVPAR